MKQFKDTRGEAWTVAVNGGTIKRASGLLGVDLGNPQAGSPPLLTRIDTDFAFLVDLLYVVVKPEADQRNLSDVQFSERLEGEALALAHDAFMEEWADFFRSVRRSHLEKLVRRQMRIVADAVAMADKTVSSPEFDQAVRAKMAELGESFASLPGSVVSNPSHARSAN